MNYNNHRSKQVISNNLNTIFLIFPFSSNHHLLVLPFIPHHQYTMSVSTENPSMRREIWKSTGRIFKASSSHFHALSVLFLLPIFFSLVVYPCFHLALFHPDYHFSHLTFLEVIVPIVYTLFLVLLFLCGLATITYSAVEAFYDRPINLVSSIKSIRNSFFPLLSTLIVSQTIFGTIILVFALVLVLVVQILQSLGLEYDSYSNEFLYFGIFASTVLVPVLLWLQINWSLAYVVALVESKWGFEALRKSAYLVKGKRWVVFRMLLFYGLVTGVMVVSGSMFLVTVDAAKGDNWRSLGVILQTAECSVLGFVMMNQYLVMNVVLYMFCNGEKMPLEIGDNEYVSLPLDDEKNHASV